MFSNSAIYQGVVTHRRFSPKKHHFSYSLFMFALDVADIENNHKGLGVFGFSWFHPMRFLEKDYLRGEPNTLRERITNKIQSLNGHQDVSRILMLVQVRCFGIYFSPANFYFCYDKMGNCNQMLVEVSNTPWNERHYYLVDLLSNDEKVNKKEFQVSPFMDLNMSYFWHVKPPSNSSNKMMVNIQNKRPNGENETLEKIFDASLILQKRSMNKRNLLKTWLRLPVMTLKVVASIYWQALRIFVKKIPFIGYQQAK